jgi:hypothetical protein
MEVNYHGYQNIIIHIVKIDGYISSYALDSITIEYDNYHRVNIRPYSKRISMMYGLKHAHPNQLVCKSDYFRQNNKINHILLYGGFAPLFMNMIICSKYEIQYTSYMNYTTDSNPLNDLKNGIYGYPLCNVANENHFWNISMTILEHFLEM